MELYESPSNSPRQQVLSLLKDLDRENETSIWATLPTIYVEELIDELSEIIKSYIPVPDETIEVKEFVPPLPRVRMRKAYPDYVLSEKQFRTVRSLGGEKKPLDIASEYGWPIRQVNYALLCWDYTKYLEHADRSNHVSIR